MTHHGHSAVFVRLWPFRGSAWRRFLYVNAGFPGILEDWFPPGFIKRSSSGAISVQATVTVPYDYTHGSIASPVTALSTTSSHHQSTCLTDFSFSSYS